MSSLDTKYTEDGREFYLSVPDSDYGIQRVAIKQPSRPANDSGIRLYCTMFNTAWELQVRGFGQSRSMEKKKRWYYGSASLNVEQLTALRDACNAALESVQS